MRSPDLFIQTNPAFVAITIKWLAEGFGHQPTEHRPLPGVHPLAALAALALLAPEDVRRDLPRNANAKLAILLFEHPEWRTGLADGARALAPAFWSGVALGVATGALRVANGRIQVAKRGSAPTSAMAIDLRKRASALGKIMAHVQDDHTLLQALGASLDS